MTNPTHRHPPAAPAGDTWMPALFAAIIGTGAVLSAAPLAGTAITLLLEALLLIVAFALTRHARRRAARPGTT